MESLGFGLGFAAFVGLVVVPLLHFLCLVGLVALGLQLVAWLFGAGR